jgi:sugar/nucleoside kinase (ribokinase family)
MATSQPDYLVIGHVCRDIIPGPGEVQYRFGGTATYSGRTARALGLNVAVVTSAAPDLALVEVLPDIQVHCVPSASTTTFENCYEGGRRRQIIHAPAARIGPGDVPAAWRQPSIVHLGPVAQEVDLALAASFESGFVGVTPQGWFRAWDEQGQVRSHVWDLLGRGGLTRSDAIVLSIEDVGGDESLVADWAARAPWSAFAVTRGALGVTLYVRGEICHIPAPSVSEVDPTGAGDIFAAVFFIRLHETRDPYEAARFAVCLASASVTRLGLAGIPTAAEIEWCQGECGMMNVE